jgi:outer membrane protein assembly factor BamB
MKNTIPILLMCLSAMPAWAEDAGTWPQWRGPNRDGIVRGSTPWPTTPVDKPLVELWQVNDLGASYSGPIVTADRIFTTATVNKKSEVVTALDRKTGKKLWSQEWAGSIDVPFFAARNGSWIRSTPAFDGQTLYVAGIRDLLVALNAEDGKILWKVDFTEEFKSPIPAFGFVCSPLVDGDAVFVQAGSAFVKVDKKTGKVLWRTLKDDGGMMGSAFSSPVVATVGGKEQVVVQTRTKLAGVDRASGEVLWERTIPSFRGMNILTPISYGSDGIFTSTYGGNTQLFRIKTDGAKLITEDGWSFKYEGHMTTPVVIDGHAYLLGKDQRLICVNLESGKETWRSDKRFGTYWSIVAQGDKILGLDDRGILYMFKANPKEYEPIWEMRVSKAETWAHISVCGSEVFIRDLNGLTVFRWVTEKK